MNRIESSQTPVSTTNHRKPNGSHHSSSNWGRNVKKVEEKESKSSSESDNSLLKRIESESSASFIKRTELKDTILSSSQRSTKSFAIPSERTNSELKVESDSSSDKITSSNGGSSNQLSQSERHVKPSSIFSSEKTKLKGSRLKRNSISFVKTGFEQPTPEIDVKKQESLKGESKSYISLQNADQLVNELKQGPHSFLIFDKNGFRVETDPTKENKEPAKTFVRVLKAIRQEIFNGNWFYKKLEDVSNESDPEILLIRLSKTDWGNHLIGQNKRARQKFVKIYWEVLTFLNSQDANRMVNFINNTRPSLEKIVKHLTKDHTDHIVKIERGFKNVNDLFDLKKVHVRGVNPSYLEMCNFVIENKNAFLNSTKCFLKKDVWPISKGDHFKRVIPNKIYHSTNAFEIEHLNLDSFRVFWNDIAAGFLQAYTIDIPDILIEIVTDFINSQPFLTKEEKIVKINHFKQLVKAQVKDWTLIQESLHQVAIKFG